MHAHYVCLVGILSSYVYRGVALRHLFKVEEGYASFGQYSLDFEWSRVTCPSSVSGIIIYVLLCWWAVIEISSLTDLLVCVTGLPGQSWVCPVLWWKP